MAARKPRALTRAAFNKQGSDGTPMRGQIVTGSIKANSVLEAAVQRGTVTRAEALLVWDRLVGLDPNFFDTYPRDHVGEISDDEKVEIISQMVPVLLGQVLS